jgi:hypothetical protein
MGILISIVLPLLRKQLPVAAALIREAPPAKTYWIIGLFSLLTAVLVVAFGGAAVKGWEWYTAILAGYAWDSTLQKIIKG